MTDRPAAPEKSEGLLTPKPLPPVQRLSRAVLVVAAGLVTITLLAVAFLATPRPLPRAPALARPPAPGEPGFLQRPPGTLPASRPELTEQEYLRRLLERGPEPAAGRRGSAGGAGDRPWGSHGAGGAAGGLDGGDLLGARDDGGLTADRLPGGGGPLNLNPPPAPSPPRDLRREAFLRALRAPLSQAVPAAPRRAGAAALPWPPLPSPETLGLDGAGGGGGGEEGMAAPGEELSSDGLANTPPPQPGGVLLADRSPLAARGPSSGPGGLPPDARSAPAGGPPARAFASPGALAATAAAAAATAARAGGEIGTGGATGGEQRSALGLARGANPSGAAADPFAPASRGGGSGGGAGDRGGGGGNGGGGALTSGAARKHVLPAGTVVPALLLTEVNSDLPGPLMAQVSRDVYDLAQRQVVLARGTRLLGRYDHQVAVGQRRLLVAWTRLQLLDGTLIDLPGLPGADLGGAAGLPARVQNHLLRVFGDAALLSLLAAGADLSQPPSRSLVAAPSAGSIAGAALGQQLAEAGTQLLRRDLSIQPTLRLPAGTPLTVFVNGDLLLAPPGTFAPGAGAAAPPGGRP